MSIYVDLIINITYLAILVWTAANLVNFIPKPAPFVAIVMTFLIVAPMLNIVTVAVLVAIALPINIIASATASGKVL